MFKFLKSIFDTKNFKTDENIVQDYNKGFAKKDFEIDLSCYTRKKDFLSSYEKKLYFLLLKYISTECNNKYTVFPKVKASDLLYINWRWYHTPLNRVNQLHIDFVIVDNQKNLMPILLIELDDKSHFLQERKIADWKKDKIFNKIWPKLIRIKWYLDENTVKENIGKYLV